MEPEGSLPYSQEPTTGSYPEPDVSVPHHNTLFSKIHRPIYVQVSIFPTKMAYACYTAHSPTS
jgi:hypothetical protein